MCQYLGVPIPQLLLLARRQETGRPSQSSEQPPPPLVCPCHLHVIDTYGDHIHTCRQHTGSTKDAHETILDALQQICHESGLTTQRRDIPSVRKANGKTGRGDLLIKDANIGGDRHLVMDIACTHEFCGDHRRDVTHNGQKVLNIRSLARGLEQLGLKLPADQVRALQRENESVTLDEFSAALSPFLMLLRSTR